MSICSIPIALITVWWQDYDFVQVKGFFFGYNWLVFWLILVQGFGGLVVAVVVKFADNILKGFAAGVSIITSCAFSFMFLDFRPTEYFFVGAALVIFSSYYYSQQPVVKQKSEPSEPNNPLV
jgi:UDP-sugar transporter A1/2/3